MPLSRRNARRDHKFTAANLSAYLDGELTSRQKQRVEEHLLACEPCRRDLAQLERTVALLRRAPMRPVPRSFALPASAQSKQAAYRRWNSAYGVLRTASVMVSLLLVLLFSGDALIGRWLAPAVPVSLHVEEVVLDREQAAEAPMLATAPAAAEAAREAVEAPQMEAPSEAPPPMALMAPAEVTAMVEREAPPESALAPGLGGGGEPAPQFKAAPPPVSVPQTSGARLGSAPTSVRRAADAATPGGVMMLQAPSPEQGIAESAEDGAPSPTAAELSALPQGITSTPWHTPTDTELAAKRALDTPMPDSAEATPLRHIERSPWWSIWRGIRLASGVFLGMLLMLVATLVLIGQKRRI